MYKMYWTTFFSEGVLKEMMDTSPPLDSESDRDILADLYAMVVSGGDHCFPFLEQHVHLLDREISLGMRFTFFLHRK